MQCWGYILGSYVVGLCLGWLAARMYYGDKLRVMRQKFFRLARAGGEDP